MPRKKTRITIEDAGRDHGKIFELEEMSAEQAEEWAFRALSALSAGSVEMPEDMLNGGMAAIAAYGIKALGKLNFYDAKPLLVEMMSCVKVCPDSRHPQVIRELVPDDIEEVATRIMLRVEVFNLHVNFSTPDGTSTFPTTGTFPAGLDHTSTTQTHAPLSSPRAKRHT